MFGARLSRLATCYYIDTGKNIGRMLSGLPCEARVIATRYSTRPQQLQPVHSNALKPSVLSKRELSILPVRASVVQARLYATDNEQKPTSTDHGTKSQSILTRLLEEEQQQPKALTVGERGVHYYGSQSMKLCSLFSRASRKRYHILCHHLYWVWHCCSFTIHCLWGAVLLQQCSTIVLSSTHKN